MTRHQRMPHGGLVAAACLCAGIAAWVATPALASDYPPPPGPYPSGPLPLSDADESIAGARSPAPTSSASADHRAPLLPAQPDTADRGMYGATNLFGSAPPPARPAPPSAPGDAPTTAFAPRPRTDSAESFGAATHGLPGPTVPLAPASPLTSNPAIATDSVYRPPAYPAGPGFPTSTGTDATGQRWRGRPEGKTSPQATTPAVGPKFRPQGD